jgi:hypothetical protein
MNAIATEMPLDMCPGVFFNMRLALDLGLDMFLDMGFDVALAVGFVVFPDVSFNMPFIVGLDAFLDDGLPLVVLCRPTIIRPSSQSHLPDPLATRKTNKRIHRIALALRDTRRLDVGRFDGRHGVVDM